MQETPELAEALNRHSGNKMTYQDANDAARNLMRFFEILDKMDKENPCVLNLDHPYHNS